MKRTPQLILALSILASLAACDSNDSNGGGNLQPGTFRATVTGSVELELSGVATSTGALGAQWGIVLGPTDPRTITIATPGQGRPPAGTYPIVAFSQTSGEDVRFIASIVAEPGITSYQATTGTLTIETSSAGRVSGTFRFDATRGTVGNPSNVSVEGRFNATNFEMTASSR